MQFQTIHCGMSASCARQGSLILSVGDGEPLAHPLLHQSCLPLLSYLTTQALQLAPLGTVLQPQPGHRRTGDEG